MLVGIQCVGSVMWSRDHGLDLKAVSIPQMCGLGLEPSGVNGRTFDIRYTMHTAVCHVLSDNT